MHPEARKIKDITANALRSLSYERDDTSASSRRTAPLYIARPHPEQLTPLTAAASREGKHPCELWTGRMNAVLGTYNLLFGEGLTFRSVTDGADSCLIFEGTDTLHQLRTLGAHLPGIRDLPRSGGHTR